MSFLTLDSVVIIGIVHSMKKERIIDNDKKIILTVGRTTSDWTYFRPCSPLSIHTIDQSLVVSNSVFFFIRKQFMEKKLKHF